MAPSNARKPQCSLLLSMPSVMCAVKEPKDSLLRVAADRGGCIVAAEPGCLSLADHRCAECGRDELSETVSC